jgi:hypothetical protein
MIGVTLTAAAASSKRSLRRESRPDAVSILYPRIAKNRTMDGSNRGGNLSKKL